MNTILDQYALIYKNISTKLLKQFFVVSPVSTSTYLNISLKSGKKNNSTNDKVLLPHCCHKNDKVGGSKIIY